MTGVFIPPASTSPFSLGSTHTFHGNVQFGPHSAQKMDIFNSSVGGTEPRPAVIMFHGGGFNSGDKSDMYRTSGQKNLVRELLDRGAVVASVNYQLLGQDTPEGLLSCVRSASRSVQFIKLAESLNVDPMRVIVIGSSAGGSIALWLATHPSMMIWEDESDPVSMQPSYVHAALGISVQSGLDIVDWEPIFAEYDWHYTELSSKFNDYYGGHPLEQIPSNIRFVLDVIPAMHPFYSSEMWAGCEVANVAPDTPQILFHHPLHIKALRDGCTAAGIPGKFQAPALGIDDGESMTDFLLRKLSD